MRVAVIARFSTFPGKQYEYDVVGVVSAASDVVVRKTLARLNAENPCRETTEYREVDRYKVSLSGKDVKAIGTDVVDADED